MLHQAQGCEPNNMSSMEVISSSHPLAKDNKSINGTATATATARSRKRRNICIGVTIAVIVLILLIIILAFTVFKAKQPETTVNSVALSDLAVSLDIARVAVDINVTLLVNLSIKNPNKVGFKYSDSTALLNYRGDLVGEAPIPADKISADQTKAMNITLTIMADRFLGKSTIFSDAVSGSMPFNTYASISGKVTILGVFKIRVVSTSSCDFIVNISNRSVGDRQCNYHTKL